MKLKKLAAGLLAAVVAVTSSVVVPVVAAETEKVLYETETVFPSDWSKNVEIAKSEVKYFAGADVTLNYTAESGAQAKLVYNPGYNWTDLTEVIDLTGTSYTFTLSEEDIALIDSGYSLIVSGGNFTLNSVVISGDENVPEFGVWKETDSGYKYIHGETNSSGTALPITVPAEINKAELLSISATVDTDGYAQVKIGGNLTGSWSASDTSEVDNTTAEIVWEVDGKLDSDIQFQFDWVNSGVTIELTDITYNTVVSVDTVTISKDALELTVGDDETLTAEVSPEDATYSEVTWSSDKPAVATVDENGKVTAVASGDAVITAIADGKSDTCTVTVTNPVTSISIDATAGILEGATKTLTVTSVPEDPDAYELVWTSSDDAVATVADGVVTGVKAGTADITATVKDTDISAVCKVTVTADTVAVTGVKLDKTELDLTKGGTAQLTATVAPEDATDTDVEWTSDKPAVATVDENGKVTAVASGEATITVTTKDGAKTASCKVTVTNPVTSITLNKTTAELEIDETVTLTATVTPADADNADVTWTSDKPAVATVDENGKVTAVASGEATITVATKDGANTATCKVTVKEAASETAYTYTYDGSAIELTLSVPSWDATQLNGQKNIEIVPTGVKLQTTTFAELKALYSGIAVEDWAVNNLTEGASESAISASIYIQNGSGWAWNAFNGTSVDFADITAIADSDPIMAIGFQINYNATGSDFKTGDVIVINGEEADSDLEDGEYSDGTYQQLDEADIPSMAFGKADVDVDEFDLAKNTYNSTFKDGKLYIYNYVSEELVESATSASVIVRYKDAKALMLTTSCVYTALDADTKAEEGMVFLAFVIDGLSADENDALYYGNYSWTHIETN